MQTTENSDSAQGPWLFIHIMKTAGTSFRHYVEAYAPDKMFPSRDKLWSGGRAGQYMGPAKFLALLDSGELDPAEIRYCFGHFPGWMHDKLGAHWRLATVLRHPVDRSISMLRHHRAQNRAELGDKTELDILNIDWLRGNNIVNYQTKVLGGLAKDLPISNRVLEVDDEIFERAKKRLESCAFLGMTERLEDSVRLWHALDGSESGIDFPHANRAKKVPPPDDTFMAALMPLLQYDLALYDYANTLFEERLRTLLG